MAQQGDPDDEDLGSDPSRPDAEPVVAAHPRWLLPALAGPLVVMVLMSQIAALTWASLVDTRPLLLIALSSLNRYLALTTNQLDPWSYYLVGGVRLLAPDPFFYALGYLYGDKALHWMRRRLPSISQVLDAFEKMFDRAAWPIVFLFPNNPVCLLAGVSRLPIRWFALANVAGTIARLVMIRLLGNVFSSPINSTLGFVGRFRWPLLAISALALGAMYVSDHRKGGGELSALRNLEQDLENDN